MKPKNPKYITVNVQFKKDLKGGHPHIIIYYSNDIRISIGFSHKVCGDPNDYYKLEINPLGQKRPAYMHRKAEIGKASDYYGKIKRGVMTMKDYNKAKFYADKKKKIKS